MISTHLPVLIVVLPLVGALIAPFLGGRRRGWTLSVAITWLVFGGCLALLRRVLTEGVVTYALGGWSAPSGIEYRIDALNALFLVTVSGVAAVVTIPGRLTAAEQIGQQRMGLYQSLYLLCLTGLLGITITGDAFNVYVLLELASLATYALVALGKDRRARLAAFRYLILGSLGATFLLLGLAYLHALTGTLDMLLMHERLSGLAGSRSAHVAAAFLLVGLGLKSALFPLHSWLPEAYTQAPSTVAALLSGTATKVGLYLMFRFTYTILGPELCFEILPGREVLMVMASAAILYGSAVALRQQHAGRLLAYSSVAQVGYIVLGLGLASTTALTGALVHVMGHAVTKAGMFLALGAVAHQVGGVDLQQLRGLGKRMPWTAAALAAGAAGLVGMPLTTGFISKWYLMSAVLDAGAWPLALVMVAGSLLGIAYAWRLVSTMYSGDTPAEGTRNEAGLSLVLPTWMLIGTSLLLGIKTDWVIELASRAVEVLT
jgi:multicomponent Na+:H+ antiporter subunit D